MESADTDLLDKYLININNVVNEIKIVSTEDKPVPMYIVSITNISDTTKLVLEKIREEFVSKMAVEDSVNLKRDVVDNSLAINRAFDDIDEIWDELDSQSMSIMRMVDLQQSVDLLESTLEFISRENDSMLD